MSKTQVQTKGATMTAISKKESWAKPKNPPKDLGVNSVAVSADGKVVVSGTFFFNKTPKQVSKLVGVYVYDETGTQKMADKFMATAAPRPQPPTRGDKAGVHCVTVTRDGKWAASGGETDPAPNATGFIRAYHIDSATTWILDTPPEQTSGVALSDNGKYLIAGADQLYLYTRNDDGEDASWSVQTLSFPSCTIKSVTISADGTWIVAGISGGGLALVKNNGGTFGTPITYQLPTMPGSSPAQSFWVMGVAMAKQGNAFAACGSDASLYYFSVSNFPTTQAPEWSQPLPGCSSCRSVAITDSGSLIAVTASAVGTAGHPSGTGLVFLYDNLGAAKWTAASPTRLGPNTVSIDQTGNYVAASDGTPRTAGKDGDFYVFNNSGTTGSPRWDYKTNDMNFAIQLSANGTVAVGGSDDGKTYYFSV